MSNKLNAVGKKHTLPTLCTQSRHQWQAAQPTESRKPISIRRISLFGSGFPPTTTTQHAEDSKRSQRDIQNARRMCWPQCVAHAFTSTGCALNTLSIMPQESIFKRWKLEMTSVWIVFPAATNFLVLQARRVVAVPHVPNCPENHKPA